MAAATRARRPNAEAQCNRWNRDHPIGSAVIVVKDNGAEVETKTRSLAGTIGRHTAIIFVEGITGGYLLERVRPVPKEKENAG